MNTTYENDVKLKDLTFRKKLTLDTSLTNEQSFIYKHGMYNCEILKFKSEQEITKSIQMYDTEHEISEDEIRFISENAGKEVLCYICHRWEEYPDVFVYGDDNIAFQLNCFE